MEWWWGKVNDLLVNVPKVTLHCLCHGTQESGGCLVRGVSGPRGSALGGGGSGLGGVWSGGVCLHLGGVWSGGVCLHWGGLLRGCLLPGGLLPGGGVSQHALRQTPSPPPPRTEFLTHACENITSLRPVIKASAIVVDRQKNETLTKVHQLRIKEFKLNVLRLKLINSFGGYHITC